MSRTLSPDAVTLIKTYEGCPPHPEWPGGESGITLGYGVDIGADSDGLAAWKPFLSDADYARLEKVTDLTGSDAEDALPSVKDIKIDPDDALTVFEQNTAPTYIATTQDAFPNTDSLPDDSFGALVSLVYNRGPGMTDKPGQLTRANMRAIRDMLAANDPTRWPEIVTELAKMALLWNNGQPNQGASNLSGRRLAEASLAARGLRSAGQFQNALIKGDKGDHNSRIAAMQKALKIGADGIFGADTMVAVWKYQKTNAALTDTGVADSDTLTALGVA